MAKKSNNRILMTLNIFWEGIVLYCKNLDTFIKYMFFPVFGAILGLILIFAADYYFIISIPDLIKKYPVLDNIPLVFTLVIICVFPGFLIFCKAFFDYMVAMASLNSMVYVSRGGKMKNKPLDTKAHDDLLKNRLAKYILFLLILAVISTIGMFPLFIIPFGVIAVYLCLIFQVFMLEESTSVAGVFKRSFYLVKGNFLITFILLALSFGLTYVLLPNLLVWAVEKGKIIQYLALPVQNYLDILPIKAIIAEFWEAVIMPIAQQNPALNQATLSLEPKTVFDTAAYSLSFTKTAVTAIMTGMLLPLRCAWFTLLYKTFDTEKTDELRKSETKKGK